MSYTLSAQKDVYVDSKKDMHIDDSDLFLQIYLKPKVTLHCYYIYHFWVLVSGILNVFISY